MQKFRQMEKVNHVGNNDTGSIADGQNLNTQRQYIDTSETFISERLRQAYRQAIADTYVKGKLKSIKHFTYDGTLNERYYS